MNINFPLTILAGSNARKKLAEQGWNPELFSTLVGASGGAKMLGIVHLDRFLFGDYLQRSQHPMSLYGSSIGSWRHAALAAPDPLAAVTELQERYLNQSWDEDDPRSAGEIVDGLCDWVMDGFCTEELKRYLCDHPRFSTHIIVARGRGLNGHPKGGRLGLGMGLSAMGNMFQRNWLSAGFQRVVFRAGTDQSFDFQDFDTEEVQLQPDNVRSALLASGSIPFLMSGQTNIPGAAPGHYWDGGIIDYHFDFVNYRHDGIALYPHFSTSIIKGWFDKFLPKRVNEPELLENVVLLGPSDGYLARLPYGKVPDRKDFSQLSKEDRVDYWHKAVAASQELADAFAQVVEDADPLARVRAF